MTRTRVSTDGRNAIPPRRAVPPRGGRGLHGYESREMIPGLRYSDAVGMTVRGRQA